MVVYQIQFPFSDLSDWEDRLSLTEPETLVFTQLDRERACLEATFADDTVPLILQASFGGEITPVALRNGVDGWECLPAKIGSRFLVVDPMQAPPPTAK